MHLRKKRSTTGPMYLCNHVCISLYVLYVIHHRSSTEIVHHTYMCKCHYATDFFQDYTLHEQILEFVFRVWKIILLTWWVTSTGLGAMHTMCP